MTKTTLIEFPCHFPIKIIGPNSETFPKEIKEIILKHFPEFADESLTKQASKQGNFLSFTATVMAENQAMLDDFYRELSKHPEVKMVL